MYEKYIYILWNITMTSLPIMYYALFDFEHEKGGEGPGGRAEVGNDGQREGSQSNLLEDGEGMQGTGKLFMAHPLLYRIGIER